MEASDELAVREHPQDLLRAAQRLRADALGNEEYLALASRLEAYANAISTAAPDACRDALTELVECKDLKDRLDRIEPRSPYQPGPIDRNYRAEELREEYERRRPLAWAAARTALAQAVCAPDTQAEAIKSAERWLDGEGPPWLAESTVAALLATARSVWRQVMRDGPWRVGKKVPINVYEGGRPVCQCHTAADARRIVTAMNAECVPAVDPAERYPTLARLADPSQTTVGYQGKVLQDEAIACYRALLRAEDRRNVLRDCSSEWVTERNSSAVTCHSRMVEGVLCRWWGDGDTPKGVAMIDRAASYGTNDEEKTQ